MKLFFEMCVYSLLPGNKLRVPFFQKSYLFTPFDHVANVDTTKHNYLQDDLDYPWIYPYRSHTIPLVPLTQSILEKYGQEQSLEVY